MGVDLYLVRHAIAEPFTPGRSDASRPLTAKGRSRFRRCVRGLRCLDVTFDLLLHSPLLRAVQTADELGGLVECSTEETGLLAQAPGLELLARLTECSSAALVGHEPWMGDLVGLLLTGEGGLPPVSFKKGAVAWLRGEPRPGGMELVAFLPPRVLVELKG